MRLAEPAYGRAGIPPVHRQHGACLPRRQPCAGAQTAQAYQSGHGGAVPHASYGRACAAPRGRGVCRRAPAAAEGGYQCPAGRRACPARVGSRQAFSVPSIRISAAARSQAPGFAGGLCKLWKGILPASLSRGTECSVSCIACPDSRKRCSSRCVLHLFGIEYHLASLGTDSESSFTLPGTAGAVSLKQIKPAARLSLQAGRWCTHQNRANYLFCFHGRVFSARPPPVLCPGVFSRWPHRSFSALCAGRCRFYNECLPCPCRMPQRRSACCHR